MSETEAVVEVGGGESEWKPRVVNNGKTDIVASNPFALIQHALDARVDADQLEKLMGLQERWEANEARKAFMIAFSECQAKLPKVLKNKKNTHTGNSYPDLESVNSTVIPAITEFGFSMSFSEVDIPDPKPVNVGRMRGILRHRGGYSEEHHVDLPITEKSTTGKDVLTPTHAKGAWSTYAQRYLTCSIWSITIAGADTDGVAPGALMTEEQLRLIRAKMADCENVKNPINEHQFIEWLSKEQKSECHVLEEVQSRFFTRAMSALDKKWRAAGGTA